MDINYDAIRYARHWRYLHITAPNDEPGTAERVEWIAFPTPKDRADYIEGIRASNGHIDILSEEEIAVAIKVKSRQDLWKYFVLDDPQIRQEFLQNRYIGFYGKSEPDARAPDRPE